MPLQVPRDAVKVFPSSAVPAIVGGAVFVGAVASAASPEPTSNPDVTTATRAASGTSASFIVLIISNLQLLSCLTSQLVPARPISNISRASPCLAHRSDG